MKCPECAGNNAFEVIPDDEDSIGEDFQYIDVECYDCGHTWTEDIDSAIEAFDDEPLPFDDESSVTE